MDDADDRADVESAKAGDRRAFDRLVRRRQAFVARRMVRFSRDRRMLEELVQDVFVEAYFSLAGYRAGGPFDHWLAKIAVRVGYRYWKRRRRDSKRRESLEDWSKRAGSPPTVASLSPEEAVRLLESLLDQLAPRDRLALTLMHLEGRSAAEAAELAGWSRTMMKVQAFRARRKLRTLLESLGVEGFGDLDAESVAIDENRIDAKRDA